MGNFTGTLNQNEVTGALYNMIISIDTFAGNIKGTFGALVDKARVDGSKYGDKKLYISTDCLKSADWLNDAEAQNLLMVHRAPAPSVQEITLNKFRQIRLSIDEYMTPRAFKEEYAYSSFISVVRQWISDTKKVYDSTTYNAFFGTCHGNATKSTLEVALSDISATGEEKNRLEAQMIAQAIADLLTDMSDVSRDYNDYGYLRSYDKSEVMIVWNAKFANKITKLDLPTIFHKDIISFDNVLPARYFGNVNTGAKVADANTRSLIEQEIAGKHYFAGDLIKTGDTAPAGTSYQVDADVIAKVVVKLPPFMSGFEVGTSFYNPRALLETNFLTWSHNTLEALKGYPFITVHAD